MKIAIDRIIFRINIFYVFLAIGNFTDSGLANFGKSLQKSSSIKFYFFKFLLVIKKITIILQ